MADDTLLEDQATDAPAPMQLAQLTVHDLEAIRQAQAIAASRQRQQEQAERMRIVSDQQAALMEAQAMRDSGVSDMDIMRKLGTRLHPSYQKQFKPIPPPPSTGYLTNFPGNPQQYLAEPDRFGQTHYKPAGPPPIPSTQGAIVARQDWTEAAREAAALAAKHPGIRTPEEDQKLKQLKEVTLPNLRSNAWYRATNTAPAVAAPVQTPAENTVERVTKDGRRAIFDAATKRFIRYAD